MKIASSTVKKLSSFCISFLIAVTSHAGVSGSAPCPLQSQSANHSPESFLHDLKKHIASEEENRNGVPYYVLGLDEGLKAFTHKVKEETHHPALYYENLHDFSLSNHPLKSKLLKGAKLQKKYHSVKEWMPVFKKTMQNWAEAAPNGKPIYFNLDHFNLKRYRDFTDQQKSQDKKKASKKVTNFTNAEMEFILSDKKIFNQIRWYVNNRELNRSEIESTFKDVAPNLF